MNFRELARECFPPILLKLVKRFNINSNLFEGEYATWADAKSAASGYDSDIIFQQVRAASLKVMSGDAVYERDSICFYEEDYRWPTLANLLSIAAKQGGHLHVLDFGGSLGSFYFQHRKFLGQLNSISWSVVEQAHFVECGRNEFQNEELHFYKSIEECFLNKKIDVVFLSSVLQYIEFPHATLSELAKTEAPYFLIDRTPVNGGLGDRLAVQKVPKSIFSATLPVNLLSETSLNMTMAKFGYVPVVQFVCEEQRQGDISFVGILYNKEAV